MPVKLQFMQRMINKFWSYYEASTFSRDFENMRCRWEGLFHILSYTVKRVV